MKTQQLPAEVREVADAIISTLGEDLRALLWHGSFARGEPGPESDHDLIIILRRIDDDVLLRLRDVFRGRGNWSTFVQSEDELQQFPDAGRLQFHFGLVPLYGEFEPPPWTRENVLADLRRLASDISFQCRYRLLHKQPDNTPAEGQFAAFQRFRNARMLWYAAKMAVLALKARELLLGRDYPETRADLRARLTDPDELAIVDLIERWPELRPRYEEEITPLALQLDAFARRLVESLPEGPA
ncbi:MAG: nucleotidyltransferase domain-containing protein [Dehalococcoidia bacterium]|nr:nucleotidyltransferase domain-containing protein [Dehalococcoidia bacterium]